MKKILFEKVSQISFSKKIKQKFCNKALALVLGQFFKPFF